MTNSSDIIASSTLKKISNYILTAILLALVIFVLSYFFHTGAGLVAERIVSVELPSAS